MSRDPNFARAAYRLGGRGAGNGNSEVRMPGSALQVPGRKTVGQFLPSLGLTLLNREMKLSAQISDVTNQLSPRFQAGPLGAMVGIDGK